MRAKTLSCWHQDLDECPPDRGRNPRCFNGLPYRCEFPQITIVCQQIRGHSVHNFAVAKSLTQSRIVGGVAFEKAAHTASHSARTPPERHAPASARAGNDREPRSPLRAYWSVYELTHRAPGSRRAAGSRSHSHGMPPEPPPRPSTQQAVADSMLELVRTHRPGDEHKIRFQ